MSDDDPFAEPDDTDRTVIRPNPGGRLSSVASPVPQASAPAPGGGGPVHTAGTSGGRVQDPGDASTGLNRLHAAAATLFALVSRIRNRAQHPDPEALRRSVVAEVRGFESRALQSGIEARDVKVARYAICATLDDVVLNTPWGGQSVWAQQSMVATFHREVVGGDRFFDLLARLEQDPANNIELLEFLYMCLTLGFEGRLRVEQNGAEKHLNIRAGLARIIAQHRGTPERDLSPHWPGLDRPHKPRSAWKAVWIASGVSAILLVTGFVGLTYALTGGTNRTAGELSALASGTVPTLAVLAPPVVKTAPPPDAELERVSGFLEEEIAEGIVKVFQDYNTITIRLTGSNMFASASDQLTDRFEVPLARVAAALKDTEGPIIVVGHSDNVPIRSGRWPSNLALSLARAESVLAKVAGALDDPTRLTAEGRADKDPIATNKTSEGRAQNRRIEIVLVRKDR